MSQDYRSDPLARDPDAPIPTELTPMQDMRVTRKVHPHFIETLKRMNDQMEKDWPVMQAQEFATNWLPLFHYPNFEQGKVPIFDYVHSVLGGNPYRGCHLTYPDGTYAISVPPVFDNNFDFMNNPEDNFLGLDITNAMFHAAYGRERDAVELMHDRVLPFISEREKVLHSHYYSMNKVFEFFGVKREVPEWIREIEDRDKPKDVDGGTSGSTGQASTSSRAVNTGDYDGMVED